MFNSNVQILNINSEDLILFYIVQIDPFQKLFEFYASFYHKLK